MKEEDYQSVNSGKRKKGFLCVPNYWLDDFYSDEPERRNKARIYLCLLKHVYFADGEIVVNGQRMPCRKGEWVTTYRQLEQKTGVARTTISRLIKLLAEEGNIRVRNDGHFTFVQFPPAGVPKDIPASDGKEPPPAKPAKPRTPPASRPNYNKRTTEKRRTTEDSQCRSRQLHEYRQWDAFVRRDGTGRRIGHPDAEHCHLRSG